MVDYYSILEINENASTETVEKVHKLLIKKYHPDLQPEEKKKEAEDYLKLINEAYEVLTDPVKKQQYDAQLKEYRMQEIIEEMKRTGKIKTGNNSNSSSKNNTQTSNRKENEQTTDVASVEEEQVKGPFDVTDEEIRRQAQVYYDELYNQYLYRHGYIRDRKKEFKDWLARVLTLIVVIGMLILIVKLPYTRNIIKELIASNPILDTILGGFFK